DHFKMAKGARFGAKPPTSLDVTGQNFALELPTLTICKQRIQLGWSIDRRRYALLQRAAAIGWPLQSEPVVGMRPERDDVARFFNRAKQIAAENLHRDRAGETRQIEFHRLREPREIRYHKNCLVLMPAEKGENFRVIRVKKFKRAAGKRLEVFAHRNDTAHPPEQRGEIFLLVFNVDSLVVIFRVDRDRQIKLLRISPRKSGIAVRAPLHGGAATVAIAEIKVIPHTDLISVINDRCAGHGEQQRVK